MRRLRTTLGGALAAVVLTTGCGAMGGDDPQETSATRGQDSPTPDEGAPEPSEQPEPSEAPSEEPTEDGPPFPEDTASQTADPEGDQDLLLTDVRVGSHDGYDRLVLEFSGTSTPGWSVGYVEEPRQDGSGESVDLAGDSYLDVYAAGTAFPEGDYYDGPQQFAPEDGGRIVDVRHAGWFEGYEQVLVGLTGDATPVRVFALSDPPRLVVDVSS